MARPRNAFGATRVWPCALLLACGAATAQDVADKNAIDRAAASIQWLNNFSCPSVGLALSVKGMQNEAETAAQIDSSWNFVQGRVDALRTSLTQREAVLRQAKAGDNYDAQLARFDAQILGTMARVGTSLVNWSLANWVEISRLDAAYPYPTQGPHPLARHVQRNAALGKMANTLARLPGSAEYVQPIVAKFHHCLLVAQNQIVERNADSMRIAMNAATRSSDASQIVPPYGSVDPGFASDAVPMPEVVKTVLAHVATLKERERVAAEEAARRLAEQQRTERERAAQQAQRSGTSGGGKPQVAAADPPVDMQARLRAATALVQALSSRSVSDALRHMTDDVLMSSPMGTVQGKQQVSSSLQQAFSSGRSGSLGAPYISGSQIMSSVQSPRGTGTMVFGFRDTQVNSLRVR